MLKYVCNKIFECPSDAALHTFSMTCIVAALLLLVEMPLFVALGATHH